MNTDLAARYADIDRLAAGEPVLWRNSHRNGAVPGEVTLGDVIDADARLRRFAAYLAQAFPDTAGSDGIIESELVEVPSFRTALEDRFGLELAGRIWLKADYALPISGSIKARGGIYEVLALAESIAVRHGFRPWADDYRDFDSPGLREVLGRWTIAVGSTGNLGLSIGTMAARLGFATTVHMSADARQWKKDRLRSLGVEVVEHSGSYSQAVTAGRASAEADPFCHFIDDENSAQLFVGYAAAALRLRDQLAAAEIMVGVDSPLHVHLPCGVGGGPGGIAFGLAQLYGEHVHCWYAEPTQAPCMLLGLATGLHEDVAVEDIGLDGRTAADGLAVGRASRLASVMTAGTIAGAYTVPDDEMFRLQALLVESEGIAMEPSALAGAYGPITLARADAHVRTQQAPPAQANHIVWGTGGAMVPAPEMAAYTAHGRALLRPLNPRTLLR